MAATRVPGPNYVLIAYNSALGRGTPYPSVQADLYTPSLQQSMAESR